MNSIRLPLISTLAYRQLNSQLFPFLNSTRTNKLLASIKPNNNNNYYNTNTTTTATTPNNNNKQNASTAIIKRFQSQTKRNETEERSLSSAGRIHTIPNYITLSRIASVPFINYFVLIDRHEVACGMFLVASITDFLDGYIARNWPNQQSSLGSILDPLADKLLIGSLTVTLTVAGMLPVWLGVVILARDVALLGASLVVRYQLIDEPKTFRKYVNVRKYSTVRVEADSISKFNTFVQLSLITLTLPSVLFDYSGSGWLMTLQYLTGSTTLLSSLSYLYKRGSYKLIKKNNK